MPVRKRCITCGREFECKPSHVDRMQNCSVLCRKRYWERRKNEKEAQKVAKVVEKAAVNRLSPAQSSKIRGQIANFVRNQLDLANEVILGNIEWSPTQARVFATLLNKVVPDLSASYHQHEINHKDVIDLSRDELERIAAGIEVSYVENSNASKEQAA